MHTARATATILLLSAALITTTVPAGASDQPGLREQNREWLIDNVMKRWAPEEDATMFTGHGQEAMTWDEAMDRLLDRLEAIGLDLDAAFGGPVTPQSHSHGPANHTMGDFGIFESNHDPEIGCNRDAYGSGGHYDYAVQTGSHGVTLFGIPIGTHEYVGTATSRISLGDDARAFMYPRTSIEVGIFGVSIPGSQGYADEIRYEGTSNFRCWNFGDAATVNAPVVRGTFGPTAETPIG